jgi:hypothetical protein
MNLSKFPAVVLERLSVPKRTEAWAKILQDETNQTFLAQGEQG